MRPTRGSPTGGGASCTVVSPRSSSSATGDRPEEAAELLSLHYFNAGRWEEAWKYSRMAGDLAREVYANVDAARFYERALEATRTLRTSTMSSLQAPGARSARFATPGATIRGAMDALKEAIRLLKDDPVAQAEISEVRVVALMRHSSYTNAQREMTAGLKRIGSLDTPRAKHAANNLLARRAQIYLQQGRPRETIPIATSVINEMEPLGQSVALARAYSALEGAYLSVGEPEKAVYEEKALAIFRSLGARQPSRDYREQPWREGLRSGQMG